MQNHRSLHVYQASLKLSRDIYAVADLSTPSERFRLCAQMRRAAISVGSNIAEGCGRATSRDFSSFLDNALGSARELGFQLAHARDCGLVSSDVTLPAIARTIAVQKMLTSLIVRVRAGARCRKGTDTQ